MQAAHIPAHTFKRSPFEILGESFAIFGKRFRSLIVIALIVQLPLVAIEMFAFNEETVQRLLSLQANFGAAQQTDSTTPAGLTQAPPQSDAAPAATPSLADVFQIGLLMRLIGYMTITVMLNTFLTAAIAHAVGAHYAAGAIDVGRSIGRAWWRILTLIVIGLLFPLAVLLTLLGFALFILPGVAMLTLIVYWSVTTQAAAIEGCKPIAALKRSFALVRQNWLRTFAAWLLMILVIIGISTLIGILAGVLSGFGATDAAILPAAPIRAATNLLSGVITAPLIAIAGALIYLDLRSRKDDYNPDALSQDLGIIQPTPGYQHNYGR